MDSRFIAGIALALCALAAPEARASVLYKSVSPSGTVMFSDTPPPDSMRVVERREIRANGAIAQVPDGASAFAAGGASLGADNDAALARASEAVDLAERAFAMARRSLWSTRDGLRLVTTKRSQEDEERVEFYRRNWLAARKALMEVLSERRKASATPGAPIILDGLYAAR